MKKLIALAVMAFLLTATGCSTDTNEPEMQDNEAPMYTASEIIEESATGAPQSYEELQDYIAPYSDGVNFLKYEIVCRYTPEEAVEITGSDIYLYSSSLYDIHITYDYLNEVPLDINGRFACAGTEDVQVKGDPLYAAGEIYASFLSYSNDEYVALPELNFAVMQGDEEYAYHIRFDKIEFIQDGVSLGADIPENEMYIVTSTSNNPVHYVKKLPMKTLVSFLKNDWISRGYTISDYK